MVILSILIFAYSLPVLYDVLFDKRIREPRVTYSTLKNDFFIHRFNEKENLSPTDTKGNKYTEQEFFEATPMMSAMQLHAQGLLPDSVNGVKINMQNYWNEFISYGLIPKQFRQNFPEYEYRLFPLFESTESIKLPRDLCRLQKRAEFINVHTNSIDEEKSQLFTEAFLKEGFHFPADMISGNSMLTKSRDDGWFITDKDGAFFHLKMIEGNPYVKRIETPEDFKIKYFDYVEMRTQEFFGFVVCENNLIYILKTEDYSLIEMPIYDYDAENFYVYIFGNILYRSFSVVTDHSVSVYALDRSYNLLNTYYEEWIPKSELWIGKTFQAIFPFHLKLLENSSDFKRIELVKFKFGGFNSFYYLYLNIALCLLSFYLIIKRKQRIKNNIIDLVIVAVTGIFGFIATQLFPNKEY